MEMKTNKIFVNDATVETNISVMTECETIVPDTKPDLLKVLQMDAEAKISSCDVSDGKITVSGMVEYKILYVPESTKGICNLEATAAFSHTEEVTTATADMYCYGEVDVEHIEFNPINSRKLSIKSVVGVSCNIMGKTALEIPYELCGDGIEVRREKIKPLSRVINKTAEIITEDRLIIAAGKPAIGVMLKNDVSIRNRDVKVIAGKIVVKGEIVISTLYIPETGDGVMSVEHTIPFTEILDAEGIREENYNRVDFKIAKATFNAAADMEGELREIACNIKMKVFITSDEIMECEVIADAYSTLGNMQVKSRYFKLEEMTEAMELTSTVKENVVPTENIPPVLHIYNVMAKPYITGVSVENGKINAEGVIDTYILYISGKEDSPVHSFKEEVPFNISIDSDKAMADNIIKIKTETNHISYNLNAAGEIELRIVLVNNIAAYASRGMNVITSVEETEKGEEETPTIVLYFIQKGDTLWDIAKRYQTKTSYIEELNGGGEELTPGKQILIPKG